MLSLVRCFVFCVFLLQTFGFPTENYFAQNPFEGAAQADDVIIPTERTTNIDEDYETEISELNDNTDEATERWVGDRRLYNDKPTQLDISGNLVQTDNEKQRSKELKYASYDESEDEVSEDLFGDENSDGAKYSDNIKIESSTVPELSRISDYDALDDLCGEEEQSNSAGTAPDANQEIINSEPNSASFLHTIPSGFNEKSNVFSTEGEGSSIHAGITGKFEDENPAAPPHGISSGFHINPTTISSNNLENAPTNPNEASNFRTIPSGFNEKSDVFSTEGDGSIHAGITGKFEDENPAAPPHGISSGFHINPTTISSTNLENAPTNPNEASNLRTIPSGFNEKFEVFSTESEGIKEGITGKLEENTASSPDAITSDSNVNTAVSTSSNNPFFHTIPFGSHERSELISTEDRQAENTDRLEGFGGFTSAYGPKPTTQVPTESGGVQEHLTARLQDQVPISPIGGFTSAYGPKPTSQVSTESGGVQEHLTARLQDQVPISPIGGFTSAYASKPTTQVPTENGDVQEHLTARLQDQVPFGGVASDYGQITTDNLEVPTPSEDIQEQIAHSSDGGFASDYGKKQTIIPAGHSGIVSTESEGIATGPFAFHQRNPPAFGTKQRINAFGNQQFISTDSRDGQQEIAKPNLASFAEITPSGFNIKPTDIPASSGITATEIGSRLGQENSVPVTTPFGSNGVRVIQTTTGNSGIISIENGGTRNAVGFDSTETISPSLQYTAAEGVGRQDGRITEPAVFSFTPTGFNETNSIEYNTVTSSGTAASDPTTYTKESILTSVTGAIPSGITPSTTIPTALQGNFVTYNAGIPSSISIAEPTTNNFGLRDGITNRIQEVTTQHFAGIPSSISTQSPTNNFGLRDGVPNRIQEVTTQRFAGIPSSISTQSPINNFGLRDGVPNRIQEVTTQHFAGIPSSISTQSPINNFGLRNGVTNRIQEVTTQHYGGIPSSISTQSPINNFGLRNGVPNRIQEVTTQRFAGVPSSVSTESPINHFGLRGGVTNRIDEVTTQRFAGIPSSISTQSAINNFGLRNGVTNRIQEVTPQRYGGIPSSVSTESPINHFGLRGGVTNRIDEVTTQRHGTVYYPTTPTTPAEYLRNSITNFNGVTPTNFPGGGFHGQFGLDGIFNEQIVGLDRGGVSPITTTAGSAEFSKNLDSKGVNPVSLNGLTYRPTIAPTNIPSGSLNGQLGLGGSIDQLRAFKEQIKQNEGLTTIVPTTSAQYLKNQVTEKVNPVSFIQPRPTVAHTNIPGGLADGFGRFNQQIQYGDLNNNQFQFNSKTSTPGFRIPGLTEGNLATTTQSAALTSTTATPSTGFDVNPSKQYDVFTGIQTTPPPTEITTSVAALKNNPPAVAPHPSIELYSRVGDQETTIPFMQKGKVTLPYEILPPKEDTRVETTTQGLVKALFSGHIDFDPGTSSNNKGFQFQSVVGGFNLGVLSTAVGGKSRPPAPERALVPKLIYKKVEDTNFSQGIIDKYTSSDLKINTVNLGSTGSINRLGDNKKTTFFNGLNIYNPSFAKFLK